MAGSPGVRLPGDLPPISLSDSLHCYVVVTIHIAHQGTRLKPQQQQQQQGSDRFALLFVVNTVVRTLTVGLLMAERDGGSARRRRERRLRSFLRHERMTVRMELAAALHHSSFRGAGPETHDAPRSQKTVNSREGAVYFELFDEDTAGLRPTGLVEPRGPLEGVQQRTVKQIVDPVPVVPLLHDVVPQMVEQLVDLLAPLDFRVAEQVIEVPMITCPPRGARTVLRAPQTAEQLVHVPTVVSYSSLQQLTAEQIVDIPVPGGGGERGSLQGSRVRPRPNRAAYSGAHSRAEDRFPRQNPAADVGQIADIPARRGLSDFLPGQGSSASSSGLHDGEDDGIQGVFRTFPRHKKSPKAPASLGPRVHGSVSSSTPAVQVRLWEWVMVLSGERPYFWNRSTGETCWEMEEGSLASWWLRPDGFYVRVADGSVYETIDDL